MITPKCYRFIHLLLDRILKVGYNLKEGLLVNEDWTPLEIINLVVVVVVVALKHIIIIRVCCRCRCGSGMSS